MGIMGSIRFCDKMSHWVQPPDAENRMSGGVAEVTGEIPSPRADRVLLCRLKHLANQIILYKKSFCYSDQRACRFSGINLFRGDAPSYFHKVVLIRHWMIRALAINKAT